MHCCCSLLLLQVRLDGCSLYIVLLVEISIQVSEKQKKKKCFCSTSILFHRDTHLCPCPPARPPARTEKNKTELEVQIILSACPRPRSPVWIPVLLLLPLLLLRPSPFTSLLISPLRSAPDSFRLYRQRHLICFGKKRRCIVHIWRALIDLYSVISPFSIVS